MRTMELNEFSGGQVQGRHTTEFPEQTWSRLFGVMLEDSGVLRSQYGASAHVGLGGRAASVVEVGDGPSVLVRVEGAGWQEIVDGVATAVGSLPLAGGATTTVPAPRDGLGFRRAALVMTERNRDAYLWSREAGLEYVTAVADRYPNDTSADAMPSGQLSVMWGDYLVVADIWWLDNDASAFSATNERRYRNALWFSQPGNPLRWDPLDIEYVGLKQRGPEPAIRDLVVHEAGLLVLTDGGSFLLRGTPDEHEIDFAGSTDFEAASLWRGAEGVIGRADGTLWFLAPDGGSQRIALPDLELSVDWIETWRDECWLVASGRLFVGRLLPDGAVAWTELAVHGGAAGAPELWPSADGLWVGDDTGLYFTGPGEPRGAWVDSLGAAQLFTSEVLSPTLSTGAMTVAHWRSFGAYVRGQGEVTAMGAYAGSPLVFDAAYVTAGPVAVTGRQTVEWRAAGPSHEAGFGFEFEGDVSVEACAVWLLDGGRQERK